MILQPHGLWLVWLLCSSLSPRVCSNSCPLSQWCRPTISSSVIPFSSCPQSFPASGSFPMSSGLLALCIRWPKYWSFSISPSSEYLEFISFKIWLADLLAVQGTLKSLLQRIHSSVFSLHYDPTITSVHDNWKNNSFDYMNLCWQSDVSAC